MAVIADYMRSSTALRFDDQAGPDGAKWKPSKRAIDEGGITLTDRGHLKGSITASSDATSAIAGTNLIYAAIHQFGGRITPKAGKKALNTPFGPRRSVTMPVRAFLGFAPEDVTRIEGVLSDHLRTAFEGGAA